MRHDALVLSLITATWGCGEQFGNKRSSGEAVTDTFAAAEIEPADTAPKPELPAIAREVAPIVAKKFRHLYIPYMRTSQDGRVGVTLSGAKIVLNRPETLTGPLSMAGRGLKVTDLAGRYDLDLATIDPKRPRASQWSHHLPCDPPSQNNPKRCDGSGVASPNGAFDCYDLVLFSGRNMQGRQSVQWISTPLKVRVANPKTAAAKIAQVTVGSMTTGPIWQTKIIREPILTADGRLMVARGPRLKIEWRDGDMSPDAGFNDDIANRQRQGFYDVVYSVYGEPARGKPDKDCDINRFLPPRPITHAPFDPNMRKDGKPRYGIAAYPFRDGEGQPIKDGSDLAGTYQWIDRGGNNLFFETEARTLYRKGEPPRFGATCIEADCTALNVKGIETGEGNDRAGTRGIMMLGLWSHGKAVYLDNILNDSELGLPLDDKEHRHLDLYVGRNGKGGKVRVGSYRAIDGANAEGEKVGPAFNDGFLGNLNIIDSLENVFFYNKNMRPVTPRDVVWHVTNGRATAEVAFDDFIDLNALVISNMAASQSVSYKTYDNAPEIYGRYRTASVYHDGAEGATAAERELRLQNAATTLAWDVPPFGKVVGEARVEPVALGGIEGRGLWLSGKAGVEYEMPAPRRPLTEAFTSLFIDPRAGAASDRQLLAFPDGSSVALADAQTLSLKTAKGVVTGVALPQALADGAWANLSFAASGDTVDLYYNGFKYRSITLADGDSLLKPVAGILRVGGHPAKANGFRGWIDDFKVLAKVPNAEVACNHARGTLIGFDLSLTGLWRTTAGQFPAASHAALSGWLSARQRPAFSRYACYHDYSGDLLAHLGNIPPGTTSVRDSFLMPEGPLAWSVARPNSTDNGFCLSCHSPQSQGALHTAALAPKDLAAVFDSRRQPHQSRQARLSGNVTEIMFGGLFSGEPQQYNGRFFPDRYVHPAQPGQPQEPAAAP